MSLKFAALQLLLFSLCQGELIPTPRHVFSSTNGLMINHPGHYPFPTDMTFRVFADHAIDQTSEFFDPDLVQKGDTIYLADFYIAWFTKYVHPKIKYPYILISNDSDCWHPESGVWDYDEKWGWSPPVSATRTLLYDSKVAAWFCKNMLISRHPKIVQIPIGQYIIYWSTNSRKHKELASLSNASKQIHIKEHLLYMNMQLGTNPIRPVVANLFINEPYCLSTMERSPNAPFYQELFYKDLSESKFTVAPPGYGPDTVRFWEAIVLGCIPIVKHSGLDDLYSDLPVLFVYDWEDINENFLNQKYEEIKNKNFKTEKAYFDYWANKIKEYQDKVKKDQNEFSSISATSFPENTLKNLSALFKANASLKENLLCIGAIMGLRPFELAQKKLFKTIYIQDQWGAWGHEKATDHLAPFTNNSLFKYSLKTVPINYYDNPYLIVNSTAESKVHVFFDLAYQRHNLITDLEAAYTNSIKGTLICGSMADDFFVKAVLEKFSKKYEIAIKTIGDIWYFKSEKRN